MHLKNLVNERLKNVLALMEDTQDNICQMEFKIDKSRKIIKRLEEERIELEAVLKQYS